MIGRCVGAVMVAACLAGSSAFPTTVEGQGVEVGRDPEGTPAVFERLDGEWRGSGTLLGREARFHMRWEHRGGLAILAFRNALVGAGGEETPVLEAAAIYRTSRTSPEAVWLDSRGVRIEIRWTADDSTLVADWTAPTESGRTTYHVLSADEVDVVDEVVREGELTTFATAAYRRERRTPGGAGARGGPGGAR